MQIIVMLLLLGIALLLSLAACTISDQQFRMSISPQKPECHTYLADESTNQGEPRINRQCSLETVFLPPDKSGKTRSYKLAYLEFDENGELFDDEGQLQPFLDLVSSGKSKYLVTYVYGWRHNASDTCTNVASFRTLLAYSRLFLEQREKYKHDTELVGIYVGWRVKSVLEPLGDFSAALTIYARKAVSSEIGVKVKNKLQEIHEKAKKNNQNIQSKMLVVGHSLGGNLLLKGMLPEIETRLDEYKNTINPEGRSSTEFSPILGDLTVLINPASEARNWVRIQEKMREIIGVSKTIPHPDHTGWRNAFIKKQKPVVLSITATEN